MAEQPGWDTGGVNAWTCVVMFTLLIVVPCIIGVVQAYN